MEDKNGASGLEQELVKTVYEFKRRSLPDLSETGLRRSELFLLLSLSQLIKQNPDSKGIKASDLSTNLQITPAAVTHMINSLEDEGFIERLSHPSDRRQKLLCPTPKGIDIIEIARDKTLSLYRSLIAHIGEAESRELIRLMQKSLEFINRKEK